MKRLRNSKLVWPLLVLALVFAFDLIFTPAFFRLEVRDGKLFGSLVDVLNRGAPLMLIALGMTLVIATGGVDISVGPVAAISGATAAYLIGGEATTRTPLGLAILAGLAAATLCGLWNGVLISRLGVQPIVATLILMVAGRGIAQMITEGQILTIYYKPFAYIAGGYPLGLPFPVFLALGMFILLGLLTRRTAVGLFLEAIGVNARASFYSGVDEKNVKLLVYTLSGLCAGVAGLIITSNIMGADSNNAGLSIELDAILAVVIGGTLLTGGRFSLVGSLIGALIIQSLTTTIYSVGISPNVVQVFKSVVVFIICLLQSAQFREAVARLGRRPKTI